MSSTQPSQDSSDETYMVRVWCDENGAESVIEIKAPNRLEAIENAVSEFQEFCAMAGALYLPPRHRCQTEAIRV